MSTSNQKSNSSASRPRATKRKDASRSSKKASTRGLRKASQKSQSGLGSSSTRGLRAESKSLNLKGSTSRSRQSTSRNTKSKVKSQPDLKVKSQASTKPSRDSRATLRSTQSSGRSTQTGTSPGSSSTVTRKVFIGAVAVAAFALVSLVVLLVLSHLPVFVIEGIDATASEHVSAEAIAKLANIEEGTTLLSADFNEISDNVKHNPWVKSVSIKREFPSTLGISVEEFQVAAVVLIGANDSMWTLSSDGTWIEPVNLDTSGTDVVSAALAYAQQMGCLLITDVPASVDPAQGSPTTDDTIIAVMDYQSELSSDIASQARVYYASSEGSIALVLDSGLEISLGAPEDINAKSQAITEIMANYPDQLTYMNVRVASKPTYRKVPDGTTLSGASEVVASNAAQTADTAAATTDASSDDEDSASSDDSSDDTTYDDTSSDSSEE